MFIALLTRNAYDQAMQKLIIFTGPPGVGKSTLSYKLAQTTGWALFTKDQVERSLELSGIHNPKAAYDILLDLAKLNLQNNVTVILDAVFGFQSLQGRLRDMADETGAKLYIVSCICSDVAAWRKRIEERPAVVDGWTPADWEEVMKVQGYYQQWTQSVVTIDAMQPLDENIAKLFDYVELNKNTRSREE